jgi:two-component system LytT family response regulator
MSSNALSGPQTTGEGILPRDVSDVGRLVFRSKGTVKLVPIQEIQWVEANGNYVRVFARGEIHLVRETMTNMAAHLSGGSFIRIHRSRLVNLRCVKEIQFWSSNQRSLVVMQDGSSFALSRGCRKDVRQLLK